jgi:GT2 family glycosyltransferase
MLGAVEADLGNGEIIVIDNGSTDDTAGWLQKSHPGVQADVHPQALSFARAANCGVSLARRRRVCLLNNDMEIEPGFFAALEAAFAAAPDLFCASAQIFFPPGARREETGKTAMRRPDELTPADYPVFCPEPLAGEDRSPVLYGSGGCSLYDRAKFLALGGFDEIYAPAYVEDLDLGYRAWRRGWPSVYVAGARVLHHHRATSSRFFTPEELDRLLDRNHARFLLRAMDSLEVFVPYWRHAMSRCPVTSPREIFRAASAPRWKGGLSDREILERAGYPGGR